MKFFIVQTPFEELILTCETRVVRAAAMRRSRSASAAAISASVA
jgi:hypothetical protein